MCPAPRLLAFTIAVDLGLAAAALLHWRGHSTALLYLLATLALSITAAAWRRGMTPARAVAAAPPTRPATAGPTDLARHVFQHVREGIMVTDARGSILDVNQAFCRITGYARDEVLGRNPSLLQSGRHPPGFYAQLWHTVLQQGHWSGEIWNRRKDGSVYPEAITITAVRGSGGELQHLVGLFFDITAQKSQQNNLEHGAHYDALTQLPNRVLLAQRLDAALLQARRRKQSLAVVYLDLDGFKHVNDRYGHDMGDALLVGLSERMATALRHGDTLARVGGDEFVALLTDLGSERDIVPLLGRLLQACASPVTRHGVDMRVSASIGATLYPQDGSNAEQLLRHADQAMYQAKQAGKNQYALFDAQQASAQQTLRQRIARLQQALAQGELRLHYLPKVDMQTGTVASLEALVRWQHPERGLLLPADFLPLTESSPLGSELGTALGEWVIDQALQQLRRWRDDGLRLDLRVSVNLSAHQMQQTSFMPRLVALLKNHADLPPSALEIDVREAGKLQDLGQLSDTLTACRALGILVALDNFGTGFFSFTHLKYLPAGAIKIDQRFVRDMLHDGDDLAIVSSLISLAAAFHREVVAEGVETVPQGERLLALGCTLAQGFGISQPLPPEAVPAWIEQWRPHAAWRQQHGTAAGASAPLGPGTPAQDIDSQS